MTGGTKSTIAAFVVDVMRSTLTHPRRLPQSPIPGFKPETPLHHWLEGTIRYPQRKGFHGEGSKKGQGRNQNIILTVSVRVVHITTCKRAIVAERNQDLA
jgi:hypothetical protein